MQQFYDTIDKALAENIQNIILLGDMNAKIGEPKYGENIVMGKYGYGKRNSRGECFIKFCLKHKLKIVNTMFKKPYKLRWTWQAPNEYTKNEIDFIATNKPKLVENINVITSLKHPSDHRLVRATLNIKTSKKSRSTYCKPNVKYIDYKKFRNELLKYEYNDNQSIQTQYNDLEQNIIRSSKISCITKSKEESNHVITPEIIQLQEQRQMLKNKTNKTKEEKHLLSKLYRIIHKKIKNNLYQYKIRVIEDHLKNTGAVKKAYKHLSRSKQVISQLQDTAGLISTSRQNLLQIATDFYRKLYEKSDDCHTESNFRLAVNTEPVPQFIESEIECSIRNLKTGKSPGTDGITNEMIIAGIDVLTTPLTKIFNDILESKTIPQQWTSSEITLIFKKGDPKLIANYRPISLMSCLYKVFATTLLRRITKIVDENQSLEQAGFIRGFSTVDHIHTLKIVIEKYCEYNKPLYIAFIDYSKAFDSILHESIWQALAEQGVNDDYVKLIKEIYRASTATIKLKGQGPTFKVEKGVRQGDPLSPKLFIAVLEFVFRRLNWSNKGLNINGRYLSHLRFADDIILFSETAEELEYMIKSLAAQSRLVGLKINESKTKVMTNREQIQITVDNTPLEYVEDYIYLGHLVSFKSSIDKEVERRIKRTWNKYWSMKEVFKSKIPIELKTKAMNICLLPCLTYSCQTWPLTRKNLYKLKTCQRAIERSYLGLKLKDKVKNKVIRNQTKAKDVAKQILRLKWKWAGHTQRVKDERWTKIITNWLPIDHKRRKGRPYQRWCDDIAKVAGHCWTRLTTDRTTWSTLEEAFTALGGPYNEDE
ncbi:uncharacterized protein LOC106709987 [Papilio machaon]|uniref:uncharacterized protein LOC106709987 n=1 Tax=Papilio machaon TaxID=76193 RepID=UPI001E664869|nr:uncharacterized protein LOC106709987 [Papilio machaon]